MHLSLRLLIQFGIISILIVRVTGDTESTNRCLFDEETLWLKITTGDKCFAGTDDQVRAFLLGTNGIVCRANLNNPGNDRERNNTDMYIICCPEGFFNDDQEINMFALTHMAFKGNKGQTSYNDWFIERIELGTRGKIILNYRVHACTSSKIQATIICSRDDKNNYVYF